MASWRGVLAIALLASACGACSGSKTATPAADAGPGTWTAAAALPEPRFEAYSAVDPRDATVSDHVDIYDPRANVWAPGPPLPADSARHHLAVGVVGDVVYLLGGFVGILGATPTMTPNGHAYRLEGDRWVKIGDAPVARGGSTAQAIDGKLYVAGGGSDDRISSAELYVYDPSADAWRPRAPMKAARQHLASCAIDGKLLVVGGRRWRTSRTRTGRPTSTRAARPKRPWTPARTCPRRWRVCA